MRVFMLGWEFPPFVAGGLGTACHGLTRAMVDQGHHITFVLPKAVDLDVESHVDLLGPNHVRAEWQPSQTAEPKPVTSVVRVPGQPRSIETEHVEAGEDEHLEAATRVMASDATAYPGVPDGVETIFQKVRSGWVRSNRARRDVATTESRRETRWLPEIAHATGDDISAMLESVDQLARGAAGHYGSDLIGDSRRYALASSALAVSRDFDVVHAHDWLAYPAGIAVRAATGKPLVVHVHATEFDRSGDSVNQQVYDIERRGMHEADRVIAVSQLTKNIFRRPSREPSR
jgi:glycogen(starch) synthase